MSSLEFPSQMNSALTFVFQIKPFFFLVSLGCRVRGVFVCTDLVIMEHVLRWLLRSHREAQTVVTSLRTWTCVSLVRSIPVNACLNSNNVMPTRATKDKYTCTLQWLNELLATIPDGGLD